MGAFVEKQYKRGFFLTEENLIKIDDIIRSRILPIVPDVAVDYKIYRRDEFSIDYSSASDVAREENSIRNLVQELGISIDSEQIKLDLVFAKKGGSYLRLEAEDRDLAFLLGSDLKEYLRAEVFVFRYPDEEAVLYPAMFLLILGATGAFFMGWIGSPLDREAEQAAALSSNSIEDKLDYIIQSKSGVRESGKAVILLPVALGLLIMAPILLLKYYKTTVNVFYWGKEIQRHDKRKALHERIVWGILIAFLVGLGASFMFDFWKRG